MRNLFRKLGLSLMLASMFFNSAAGSAATIVESSSVFENTVETTASAESLPENEVMDSSDVPVETTESWVEEEPGKPMTREAFAVPDAGFDWNLLNSDGLDLSTFTEVSQNTPVPLKGRAFDKPERQYYMFFGNLGADNVYNKETGFVKKGNMLADLSISENLPVLSPVVIGVKKDSMKNEENSGIFSYIWNNTQENVARGVGHSGFDIGRLNNTGGVVEANYRNKFEALPSPAGAGNAILNQFIVKQYIKDNEIVSYGWVAQSGLSSNIVESYIPVRVHGYAYDFKEGRVRYDMTYYNSMSTTNSYAVNYGAHMDVGGAHQDSKMFSFGDDGIYFNQLETPIDNLGARVYFYTNNAGIYDAGNGPTARKMGDLNGAAGNVAGQESLNYWRNIANLVINTESGLVRPQSPYDNWDPIHEVDYQYSRLEHPVFVLRWDKMTVPSKTTGTATLDLSIREVADPPILTVEYKDEEGNTVHETKTYTGRYDEEYSEKPVDIPGYEFVKLHEESDPESGKLIDHTNVIYVYKKVAESNITVKYQDEAGNELKPNKEFTLPIGSDYDEKPLTIDGYTYIKTEGTATGTVENADPIEITFIYTPSETFDLVEKVEKLDGSSADNVIVGDQLKYTVELNSKRDSETFLNNYAKLMMETSVNEHLENIKNMQLLDKNGNVVGAVVYDEATRKMTAELLSDVTLSENESLYLSYEAQVKMDTEIGTVITGQTTAVVEYSNGYAPDKQESNIVESKVIAGELIFEEAPLTVDFGKQVIAATNKEYDVVARDGELSVRDLRGTGNKWHLTAKMQKEMTNGTSVLSNAVYYVKDGVEQVMDTTNSAIVHDEITQSNQSVVISNTWNKDNKLLLKVPAGKAIKGQYEGEILWMLHDTPMNEN